MDSHPVALVTGAARRLGAVTAKTLHARGYRVVIHHHNSAADAEALAADLNAARPDSALTVSGDLAERGTPDALVGAALARWERLDLLVNNASVFDPTNPAAASEQEWDRVFAVNARAPYFLAVRAAPSLRAREGSVVNIGDVNAERPRPGYSIYNTSKSALVALTRALAVDLAPGVRVNCVSPGAIRWAEDESPEIRERTIAATPLGRTGDPEDIARAVVFLAESPFVTGATVNVDGGRVVGL